MFPFTDIAERNCNQIYWHCDVYNQHILLGTATTEQNDIPVYTERLYCNLR